MGAAEYRQARTLFGWNVLLSESRHQPEQKPEARRWNKVQTTCLLHNAPGDASR